MSLSYKSSLIGFHNPVKHKGMTPDEFLSEYVNKDLMGHRYKKDGYDRVKLADWIVRHWDSQLYFVSRLFPKTLETKWLNDPLFNKNELLG